MSLDHHFAGNGLRAAYHELSEPLVSRPPQSHGRGRVSRTMSAGALTCIWLIGAACGSLLVQAFAPGVAGTLRPLITGSIATEAGEPIDRPLAVALARSILLRLEDANRTGNYSVFHDRATPSFRSMNSPDDLARIFAWLRAKGTSLASADRLQAQSLRPTILEKDGIVHVRGSLPDTPESLSFDLLLQQSANDWLVFGVAIYRD